MIDINFPILSIMLFLPLMGALVIFFVTKKQEQARMIALVSSIITMVLAVILYLGFDKANTSFQLLEDHTWVQSLGISYSLGVDGISLLLILLTPFIVALSIIFSWNKEFRFKEFFALLLVMETGILGVFMALDFFLFYLFWEIVLIPMYFLISIWGGPNKHYAAIKFFIYTHVASLFMMIAILAMYFQAAPIIGERTFSMILIAGVSPNFALAVQVPIFIALLFGFGVKMPMVPFHTWLPDAHVQAPTAGSVILAALLLKMGGYGMIRVAMMMLPGAMAELWWLVALFGIVSMVYGALLCLGQTDLKSLIAYSSISHMGFVLFGYAALTTMGVSGAVFQMFNHGIISAALFMLAGVIKHNTGTREIAKLRGLAARMPVASVILIFAFFASLGLPGLNGFVSEYMIFVGAYGSFHLWVLIPLVTVVLTAAYYLWTLQKMLFGKFNRRLGDVKDVCGHEAWPLLILVALMIIIGLYPTPILEIIYPVCESLVNMIPSVGVFI
jgi:NADH-quinone oxidoreductase subunit M